MIRVPDVKTALTLDEAIRAFAGGWKIVLGSEPKPRAVAILVAQSALETGNWHSMHCYNFGNVRPSKDASADDLFCEYQCDEWLGLAEAQRIVRAAGQRTDGKPGKDAVIASTKGDRARVVFYPSAAGSRFRAFRTAAEGAAQQVEFLSTRDRYRAAWHWCYSELPGLFVNALATAGYFTGDPHAYRTAVVSIASKIAPACEQAIDGRAIDAETRDHVAGMVAATLWGGRYEYAPQERAEV